MFDSGWRQPKRTQRGEAVVVSGAAVDGAEADCEFKVAPLIATFQYVSRYKP